MAQTSVAATIGRYVNQGEDFLHLLNTKGQVIGGIDRTGTGFGNMHGGFVSPPTKILYVDKNRLDSYTPDGSILKPFKTISDAINQIILNGDNAANLYCVSIAPGTYPETIILEDLSLVNIVFLGYGAATVSVGLKSQTNNSNLSQVDFRGLNFIGGAASSVVLSGSGGFLSNAANFYDCFVNIQSWSQTGAGSQFFDASFSSASTSFVNTVAIFMGNRGPTTGTTLSLANSTLAVQRGSRSGSNVTIDVTSTYNLGNGSRQDGVVTVNGAFNNRLATVSGAITINAGGTYTELGGFHTGSLTLNGGSYTQTGVMGASALQVGGIRVSAGSGAPNGVVSGSPGDVYINAAGGALTTLWVKETGLLSNLGWVGK